MASYRKRTNGWEYRLSIKEIDIQTGEPKYRSVSAGGFKTKREAEIAASKRQIILSKELSLTNITINDLITDWFQTQILDRSDNYAPNTIKMYRESINAHIIPKLGHVLVRDLSASRYQRYINELEKDLAPGTVRRVHIPLNLAFKTAIKNDKLFFNPCQTAKISKKKNNRVKYLDPGLVQDALKIIYERSVHQGIFFECLFETGMRKGECYAIMLDDLDFSNNTISINKTYNFDAEDERDLFGPPKTPSSVRTIVVRDALMQKLKSYIELKAHKQKIVNEFFKPKYPLVFGYDDGHIFGRSTIRATYNAALDNLAVERLPVHSTRHTHAVMMLEAGATMKEVQERLGHSSMQITADVYSHVTKKMQQRAVNLFDSYMKNK